MINTKETITSQRSIPSGLGHAPSPGQGQSVPAGRAGGGGGGGQQGLLGVGGPLGLLELPEDSMGTPSYKTTMIKD